MTLNLGVPIGLVLLVGGGITVLLLGVGLLLGIGLLLARIHE